MPKKQLNARIPSDMMDEIDEFRGERDLSKSDAARRLIDRGLRSMEEGEDEASPGIMEAGLSALADDAYPLARDSLLFAALALILHSFIVSVSPGWWGAIVTAVTVGTLVIAALAFLGALAGTYAMLRDAMNDEPAEDTSPAEEAERA